MRHDITSLIWILLGAAVLAQTPTAGDPSRGPDGAQSKPSLEALTIHQIGVLLRVGVSEAEIVDHGKRHGWPLMVSQSDFVALDRIGLAPTLRSALLGVLDREREDAKGERTWRAASIDLASKQRLSFLQPRGWHQERAEGTDRLVFRPRPSREPWLEAPRAFLWVEPLEDASRDRAAGLARLSFDALETSLGRSELRFGDERTDLLVGPLSGGDFPLIDGIVTRQDNARRGRLLVSARIDEARGIAIMVGLITGLPETAEDLPATPRQTLARLLDSCRVSDLVSAR